MTRHALTAWKIGFIDGFIFLASNLIAFLIRFHLTLPPYNLRAFANLLPWEIISLWVIFYIYGLYDRPTHKTSHEVVSSVTMAIITNSFVSSMISLMLVTIGLPRTVFFLSASIQMMLFLIWRLAYRSWSLRHAPVVTVLAVGEEAEWSALTRRAGQYLPRITMVFQEPKDTNTVIPWYRIGAVVLGTVDIPTKSRYFIECMKHNIPCLWKPDTYDLLVAGSELTSVGEVPMFSLASIRTRHGSAALKRLADVVVSATSLIVLLPLFLVIALVTLLDSGRPVLYFQERVTAGGKHFMLVKFRTMIPDAEAATGPILSQPHDPRVTRCGQFLRTTHLDELPQLWNVLKGDMSLVGPRPERPVFVDQHRQAIDVYDLRHLSTPGLTGLAQVAGSYTSSPEEKAVYDLHYATSWSWFKDLIIVARTLVQLPFKKEK
ncbi:sugar transferase [Sulfobacillus sp. hq2]|uniref:Exopolysaccharide biosynthesis polyprenyl glycosylphosphotransferase n=1 Tax=Sulfobacillus thermotolerans TaxID=338644 RepID=A0ABN5H236_9FIRM|nr:sugar transferase [Sulfobacillus sp. hq2]AUW94579.1 exopolysaccharide biosynthesis polyprenyl glycosylphosphotransferase [Sulfobacillus thermotolerans]POB09129.1 exopolysaccharide biosynthesis polyprenyl glycosylphosphotransferase [Sulfobacillus sp. hq2]